MKALDRCLATLDCATEADLPALAAIEAMSNSHPWQQSDFAAALRAGHLCLCARCDQGEPIGFAVGRLLVEDAELLLLAVRPDQRRRGIGRALLRRLEERLAAQGARRMFLEVRRGNWPAQRFYAALGYAPVGRRPRYYPSGASWHEREDALIYSRALEPRDGSSAQRVGE
ncbi:MAG: ribosomal protein S18-alanine N-acetyltransferase [Casimicrobiaceae bacterium]|nr:ribosomal protein S18-alanine N-acetyltransferase [Casimicrobiaceae bacterium]MCX8099533.1 ribosomal protein S18-alanine N-acetyltransferase [Casimicrobiaceae bacterium]MDW8311400.1 ribosomal protein S18-alanine N-acetyltransferase [Burkholderiales bacterium]